MAILVRWKTLFSRITLSVIAVVLFWMKSQDIKPEALINASGVITGLSGTLLGFLITSMSLITALMDKKLVINMVKTGHYKTLVSDTILTCIFLLFSILSSLITLLSKDKLVICMFALVCFFTVISILYLIESGRRFSIIILHIK